jgi:hypothetical protein
MLSILASMNAEPTLVFLTRSFLTSPITGARVTNDIGSPSTTNIFLTLSCTIPLVLLSDVKLLTYNASAGWNGSQSPRPKPLSIVSTYAPAIDVPGISTSMGCVPSTPLSTFFFTFSSSTYFSFASFVVFSVSSNATLATSSSSFSLSAVDFVASLALDFSFSTSTFCFFLESFFFFNIFSLSLFFLFVDVSSSSTNPE